MTSETITRESYLTTMQLGCISEKTAPKRIGIDESLVKLENKQIENDLQLRMEKIHLQKHRAQADHNYELTLAKAEVHHFVQMQRMMEKSYVDSVITTNNCTKKRKHRCKQMEPMMGTTLNKPFKKALSKEAEKKTLVMKQTLAQQTNLSKTDSDSKSGCNIPKLPISGRIRRPLTTGSLLKPNSNDLKFMEKHIGLRPKSTKISIDFQSTGQNQQSARKLHRSMSSTFPNTTRRVRSTQRSFSIGDDKDPVALQSGPGRSFAELRDLTHIDKLTEQQRAIWRENRLQERNVQLANHQEELKLRIERFYDDMDIFIKSTKSERNAILELK